MSAVVMEFHMAFFWYTTLCELSVFFMSTPKSRPNNVGLRCPSVRTSVHKQFFQFRWNWYVGRGRWVMHDGMPHGLIQDQGHETFKVRNSSIFFSFQNLSPPAFSMWAMLPSMQSALCSHRIDWEWFFKFTNFTLFLNSFFFHFTSNHIKFLICTTLVEDS